MNPPDERLNPDEVIIGKSSYRGKTDYSVVFEDRHLLVANKPAGLLTVPIKGMKALNLQELIQRDKGHKIKVSAAHRIDRYTTGLVVFGLNKFTNRNLADQFRNRSPQRAYLAVVRGVVEPSSGKLVHHLKQIKSGFRNIVVDQKVKKARRAELKYELVEQFKDRSLVRIELVTGLKNQIRVQFSEIGHPLLGDQHYEVSEKERDEINRQALHASELSFLHPKTRKPVHFKALLPKDMKKLIS